MKINELDKLIRVVCPIDGINSNGDIFFKPEATISQKDAAESMMAANIGKLNDIEETDFGTINSKALVRRRANELQQSGREIDALLLLKTIGE